MSEFDIEREKQKEQEIRKAFRELFPLVPEDQLPWAACQIRDFLKARIALEFELNTKWLVCEVARILCEVTPPKTHLVDMARLVVSQAKEAQVLASQNEGLRKQIQVFKEGVK